MIAIAAANAGLSGPAVATTANATNTGEDADYVEFSLGENAVRGWKWRSPFKEGDEVKVAAEQRADYYEIAGVARPSDRIVALYPHCSRGRLRHIKNAVKWWFSGTTLLFILIILIMLMMISANHISRIKKGKSMCISRLSVLRIDDVQLVAQMDAFRSIGREGFTTLAGAIQAMSISSSQTKPGENRMIPASWAPSTFAIEDRG